MDKEKALDNILEKKITLRQIKDIDTEVLDFKKTENITLYT